MHRLRVVGPTPWHLVVGVEPRELSEQVTVEPGPKLLDPLVALLVSGVAPVPHLALGFALLGGETLRQVGDGSCELGDLLLERPRFAGFGQPPHQLVVVHVPKLVRSVRFASAHPTSAISASRRLAISRFRPGRTRAYRFNV